MSLVEVGARTTAPAVQGGGGLTGQWWEEALDLKQKLDELWDSVVVQEGDVGDKDMRKGGSNRSTNSEETGSEPVAAAPQDWPSPVGLMMGITSVAVFQAVGIVYYYLRMVACGGPPPSIQVRPPPELDFWQDLVVHLTR